MWILWQQLVNYGWKAPTKYSNFVLLSTRYFRERGEQVLVHRKPWPIYELSFYEWSMCLIDQQMDLCQKTICKIFRNCLEITILQDIKKLSWNYNEGGYSGSIITYLTSIISWDIRITWSVEAGLWPPNRRNWTYSKHPVYAFRLQRVQYLMVEGCGLLVLWAGIFTVKLLIYIVECTNEGMDSRIQ